MLGANGDSLGVMDTDTALAKAREAGLDLVEIAPNANPPVAKIISYDKFRYQKEKEDRKQRHAQKAKELKQVRITPRAGANDLAVKMRNVEKFLAEGHKVEIGIYLRGREKGNKEWALQKLNDFLKMVPVPFDKTMEPRAGGRGFIIQIVGKR